MSLMVSVNSINRRVRMLEERHDNLHKKAEVIEDNMLNNSQKHSNDIKRLNEDMKNIKRDMEEIKDSIRLLIKDSKNKAKKEDVDVIKKYIELWNPANFVTQRELNKILKNEDEY